MLTLRPLLGKRSAPPLSYPTMCCPCPPSTGRKSAPTEQVRVAYSRRHGQQRGATRTRTEDLLRATQMLYQLSYNPKTAHPGLGVPGWAAAPATGFEPAIFALTGRRGRPSPLYRLDTAWRHGDSNPGHPACNTGALPAELYPQAIRERPYGLEPPNGLRRPGSPSWIRCAERVSDLDHVQCARSV